MALAGVGEITPGRVGVVVQVEVSVSWVKSRVLSGLSSVGSDQSGVVGNVNSWSGS